MDNLSSSSTAIGPNRQMQRLSEVEQTFVERYPSLVGEEGEGYLMRTRTGVLWTPKKKAPTIEKRPREG